MDCQHIFKVVSSGNKCAVGQRRAIAEVIPPFCTCTHKAILNRSAAQQLHYKAEIKASTSIGLFRHRFVDFPNSEALESTTPQQLESNALRQLLRCFTFTRTCSSSMVTAGSHFQQPKPSHANPTHTHFARSLTGTRQACNG
ncbi:unnamed protein product [Polarella glacialis]|uniref:Uncharacterized protein n=1 Tax=Polarella glacialis TaxID=89957 RepID=A0A813L872_POLGL|nr:unnamed protein product [Polarella glacialis]